MRSDLQKRVVVVAKALDKLAGASDDVRRWLEHHEYSNPSTELIKLEVQFENTVQNFSAAVKAHDASPAYDTIATVSMVSKDLLDLTTKLMAAYKQESPKSLKVN